MVIGEAEIREIFEDVIDEILIRKFNELGMNASGEWLRNLHLETTQNSAIIRGREYTEQLVHGRRPGSMPPVSALQEWARIKLGLSRQESISAGWAIAQKIKKDGTNWYQQGGTDLLEVLEKPETIQFIQNRISEKLNIKVKNYFIRELKK